MYIQQYWKVICILLGILSVCGFLTYSFISPHGIFSGLSNDLKGIETREGFSYTDLNGNIVDLEAFKGKPLIINSWATWIPFSSTELPLLIRAQNDHKNELNILAINRMEQIGVIQSFLGTFAIPNDIVFLSDPTDNFYKAVGGYAMPETVFYNSEGVLIAHKRGVLTEAELNEYITSVLKNK